jgi:hypothetical protein
MTSAQRRPGGSGGRIKAARDPLGRIRKAWPSEFPRELFPSDESVTLALDEVRFEFAIRMIEYF